VSINEKITSVRDRTFLVNHFPSSLFNIWKKKSRCRFHEKKVFRKGKEKLTNGQKCTSLAVLRMHLMIEKKMINVTSLVKKSKTGFTAKNHKPYQTTLKFVCTI
jgi:hypothetical protein